MVVSTLYLRKIEVVFLNAIVLYEGSNPLASVTLHFSS